MTALDVRKKLQSLSLRAAQLKGMLEADKDLLDHTVSGVALATGRMTLAKEAGRVFDALQKRGNQRSVGGFEQLLSAVLNDVLPEEGTVRLLPQYKNNATYLDILLEKNGGLEDVVDGNGGAVTNVVCAGLRYAALSRTSNRRLMVLDEPDCWLKPERVPAFVNVIAQVSKDMGAQTFFITHHDTSLLEDKVNLVRFVTDEKGRVKASALAPLAQDWENAEQPGIRAIELFNVRRHEHTFVPCFPGATAFIGDNNLGKSTAIGTALKVFAYGESDDSMLRHGCTEARIVLHLEANQRLEWSRVLKRSPSVMYSLYKDNELIAEGRPKGRNQAPDWVTEILRIERVDDLDLQIGNQKTPVFLLNDPSPRRAQILSVGRESSHLKNFMKAYEAVKARDSETIQSGELLAARLKAKISYLAKSAPLADALEALVTRGDVLLDDLEQREKLLATIARVEAGQRVLGTHEAEAAILNRLPETPELLETVELTRLITGLEKGAYLAAVTAVPLIPDAPILLEVADVLSMGGRLAELTQLAAKAPTNLAPVPDTPVPQDVSALGLIVQALERGNEALLTAVEIEKNSVNELEMAEQRLAAIVEELGGVCPLCENALGATNESGHVHAHA